MCQAEYLVVGIQGGIRETLGKVKSVQRFKTENTVPAWGILQSCLEDKIYTH